MRSPGTDPDLPDLRRRVAELDLDGRVRFSGPLNRDAVLMLFRAADASLLTSSWENFPHTVVEALAAGTPVIATAVGGVPELVRDGENGLLVPAGDHDALAAAIRRLIGEPGLRKRLRCSGRSFGGASAPRGSLCTAGGDPARGRPVTGDAPPRVLFVGRGRFRIPLGRGLELRFEALSDQLDWRQLGTAADGNPSPDPRLVLARPFPLGRLDGLLYYVRLTRRIARELRRFRPDAVIAQGAQETALALLARRAARSKSAVILDLHGDWRAPTRLYGSRGRRLLDPLADALARSALRRADAVRTISTYTTELVRAEGIEPAAEFPAFMDLEPFLVNPVVPLPEASAGAVRRRARALQGVRRACRSVAPGGELGTGVGPAHRRPGSSGSGCRASS